MAALALVAHHDRLLARQADLDLDLVDLGLGRAAMRCLQNHPAAGHAAEVLLQLRHLPPHPLLDGLALLDAVEVDLDRRAHQRPFPIGREGGCLHLSTWWCDRPGSRAGVSDSPGLTPGLRRRRWRKVSDPEGLTPSSQAILHKLAALDL